MQSFQQEKSCFSRFQTWYKIFALLNITVYLHSTLTSSSSHTVVERNRNSGNECNFFFTIFLQITHFFIIIFIEFSSNSVKVTIKKKLINIGGGEKQKVH